MNQETHEVKITGTLFKIDNDVCVSGTHKYTKDSVLKAIREYEADSTKEGKWFDPNSGFYTVSGATHLIENIEVHAEKITATAKVLSTYYGDVLKGMVTNMMDGESYDINFHPIGVAIPDMDTAVGEIVSISRIDVSITPRKL